MKNIKKSIARVFLLLSAISVLLTVIIPMNKMAIGQLLIRSYNGVYSAIALVICLAIFFVFAKQIEEDVWINRLKLLLSFSFLISLISNVFFL